MFNPITMAFPFWVLKMVEILRPGAGCLQVNQQGAQGGHLPCPSTASRGFNQQKMRLDQENICHWMCGCRFPWNSLTFP